MSGQWWAGNKRYTITQRWAAGIGFLVILSTAIKGELFLRRTVLCSYFCWRILFDLAVVIYVVDMY